MAKLGTAGERTGRAGRPAAAAFLGVAAAEILVRVAAAATAAIWFDEATAGLMGRGTLRGDFLGP